MLCGNGDHSANGTRLNKLQEMQRSIVRRRMPTKPIRPAMLYGADTLATTKRHENGIKVNDMRMLRWMYGETRKDNLAGTTLTGDYNYEWRRSGACFQDH